MSEFSMIEYMELNAAAILYIRLMAIEIETKRISTEIFPITMSFAFWKQNKRDFTREACGQSFSLNCDYEN